jgi:hypothetical protein
MQLGRIDSNIRKGGKKMRKYYLTVAVVLIATLISGCSTDIVPPDELTSIVGSGNIVTREEPLAGFDKIKVGWSFQVDVQQGDTYSVVVRIDDNLIEYLHVVKDDDNALVIGLDPSFGSSYTYERATMEAEVTMPSLTAVAVDGASGVAVTGFASSENLQVAVSGSSSLEGDIEAGDAEFNVSGAGVVALSGSAQNLTVHASGSSDIDLADFAVIDAYVESSGASEVVMNVTGRLDADLIGSSKVYYTGDPTLGTIHTSISSSVLHR